MNKLKVDARHSVFWRDAFFNLYILKHQGQDAFSISIQVNDKKPQSTLFTGNEFSSFVCEIVKYCLDLPIIARKIACPITCVDKPHGCLQIKESKIDKDGKLHAELDKRWIEYHGTNEVDLIWEKETNKLYLKAVKSKSLKHRNCPYCGRMLSK